MNTEHERLLAEIKYLRTGYFKTELEYLHAASPVLTKTVEAIESLSRRNAEQAKRIAFVEDERDFNRELFDNRNEAFQRAMGQVSELKAQLAAIREALLPLSKYLCGGHYEPRNEHEGKLASTVIRLVGSLDNLNPAMQANTQGD